MKKPRVSPHVMVTISLITPGFSSTDHRHKKIDPHTEERGRSARRQSQCHYLGSTFGILMVTWQHLERNRHPISPPIGTESIPDGSVDSVVNHIQARQSNERHGPAT